MTTVAELDARLEARLAEKQAEVARQHFPTYCAFVHSRPLFPHQLAWNDLLDDPSEEDILIVAPPGTYKSSLFRMRMEWELGRAAILGEDLYTLYLMNVAEQAEKQVMAIEETIESNARYKMVFPMVQPDKDKGWTKQIVFIKGRKSPDKEPNILGTGFLGPYQGYHFHRILVDDPSDPEDVMSETVMESQRYRLRGMLRDRKRPQGRIRVILTPWGPNDLRRDFKEMGFRIVENPIEGRYQWGRLLMPEVFGDDTLEELRRVKGSALFDLTYMLREEAAEGNLIKREWWRYYNQEPEQWEEVVQVWDIAITSQETKTGDWSCCGTWGVAKNGYYLRDVARQKVETPALIEWLKLEAARWVPQSIVMLTAGVGKPIYQMLRQSTRLPLLEGPVERQDPVIRLREVLPVIEAGRVYLKAGAGWIPAFLDETARYTGYQKGHDDQVAMVSGALRWLEHGHGPGRGAYNGNGGRQPASNSIISVR